MTKITFQSIMKAAIAGALLGVIYTFVVDPLITKPIEKQVEKVV